MARWSSKGVVSSLSFLFSRPASFQVVVPVSTAPDILFSVLSRIYTAMGDP